MRIKAEIKPSKEMLTFYILNSKLFFNKGKLQTAYCLEMKNYFYIKDH